MTLPDRVSPLESTRHSAALQEQIAYYAERRPATMTALDTPYIRRHLAELLAVAPLEPGATVCEWGSGLGRFSRLLLARGFEVSAVELSPELAAASRSLLADEPAFAVHCGDIADVLEETEVRFDAMLGFFVLHLLPSLAPYLRAAYDALRPGGRIAFTEPNPFNPLYPLQITLKPGMRWRAERGIYRLTPASLRRALERAGFTGIEIARYGALPRAPYNWAAGHDRATVLEPLVPDPLKPFQTIVARRPGSRSRQPPPG